MRLGHTKRPQILSFFSGEPRPAQRTTLLEVERVWSDTDVFIVSAPVAAGKSKIAECIASWSTSKRVGHAERAVVGVPSNALLDQFLESSRGYATLRARKHYFCSLHDTSCEERKRRDGGHCRSASGNRYAHDACPYLRDLGAVRSRSTKKIVANWYTLLAHKLVADADVLIFDEAHGLQKMLQELHGRTLWRREHHWPRSFDSVSDVAAWLDSDDAPEAGADENVDILREVLAGDKEGYSIWVGEAEWRGVEHECVRVLPLDVRSAPPVLWPNRRTKLILMSATLSRVDVEALGLSNRRITWIEVPSEIPEDRRPFVWWPLADMRHASREVDRLVEGIRLVLEQHKGERGVIHATYGIANDLRSSILSADSRLMFHSRDNKRAALDSFLEVRAGGDDRVLVLSGQYEGLDLVGDLARFQIAAQAPRPSIEDPGIAWLAEHRPDEYEWLAVRDLAQLYGRVCRGPADYGVTVFLDSSARREVYSKLLPTWFPHITRVS